MEAFRKGNSQIEFRQSFKSQSAMEYLMTYGWAILIIAVVLAALFELGVFNPMTFAPKASPGSCQVVRPDGAGTTNFISLSGECNGELPQYVAQFNGRDGSTWTASGAIGPNGYDAAYIVLPKVFNPSTMDALTYTAWIKQGVWASNGGGGIIGIGTAGFQTGYCGTLCFHQCNSGDSGVWFPFTPNGGQWYFVAVALNSSQTANTLNFYINNYSASTTTAELPTNGYSRIGAINCFNYYFNGSIADIQIYNTALSSNSIRALYSEGIGGAPIDLQNLVAWYPLDGNAEDYSGNGNNGVPANVTYTSNWYSGYGAP